MPSKRADAPDSVPDTETLEYLLGERNLSNGRTKRVKTLSQLTPEERLKTGMASLQRRDIHIEGDPYAISPVWAGNVGHPFDQRMTTIMEPLLKRIKEITSQNGGDQANITRLRSLLEHVRDIPINDLATTFADDGQSTLCHTVVGETSVSFKMDTQSVRVLQLHDVDKDVAETFINNARAEASSKELSDAFQEMPMPIPTQKYLMSHDMEKTRKQLSEDNGAARQKYMAHLRGAVQERYWTQMTPLQRDEVNAKASISAIEPLNPYLEDLEIHWPRRWNGGYYDREYYHQYIRDMFAAENVWPTIEEDIFIVIDCKRNAIFTSIQGLSQFLFGQEATDILARILDLWSFFTPLPFPESQRHVVDNYIRKLHPELDMSKATVDKLGKAKMCVAHYGTWAPMPGDKTGRRVQKTGDTTFRRTFTDIGEYEELLPDFYMSAMGTAAKLIRFLLEPLDPHHFQECRDIFANLEDGKRLPHAEGEDVNFLTLFAMGVNAYTQRHRDTNDVAGGFAGLVTLGSYSGKRNSQSRPRIICEDTC